MAPLNGVEVIDLTRSSPPAEDSKEDGEITSQAASKNIEAAQDGKKRGKKRKRANGSASQSQGDSTPGSAAVSRHQSVQRESDEKAGKKAEHEDDTENANGEARKKLRIKRKRTASSRAASPLSRVQVAEESQDLSESLFFVDIAPDPIPTKFVFSDLPPVAGPSKPSADKAAETSALTLPTHVTLLDDVDGQQVEIIQPPEPDSDSESYIEYLDYDDRARGIARYFNEPAEGAKQSKFVCKRCGAENEHKTFECPVLICLTCGARDEHSTRSCPVSKTCFTCGMRGHINRNCPNKGTSKAMGMGNYDNCDRCGSNRHNTNECPTIWRIYEYVTDEDRTIILKTREEKRKQPLGKGGEGYIAQDAWCYNCGGPGHLGDDCDMVTHPWDHPKESSAFSLYNTMSGPFFDPNASPDESSQQQRRPREWENEDHLPDGWGFNAPTNVGRQGRQKGRARMEQRARELEEEQEDLDDWFGSSRNARSRGAPPPPPSRGGGLSIKGSASATAGKKISFGALGRGNGGGKSQSLGEPSGPRHAESAGSDRPRSYDQRSDQGRKPSLLDRIQDYGGHRSRHSSSGRSGRRESDRDRNRDNDRRRDRDYDRDYLRNEGKREERGPRYKGGYPR